ncbi:hypothetical protein OG345_13640 [Streptomyces sp. NBC_01220]|nr:hypothetical protein OG345_13640 [Streptomyces sp. NBC_01220]
MPEQPEVRQVQGETDEQQPAVIEIRILDKIETIQAKSNSR